MKRLIIALAIAGASQTAFALNEGDILIDGDLIYLHLRDTYLKNYKGRPHFQYGIPLEITKEGKIIGTIGKSLHYKKGETLKNGQKAKNKEQVLAEAIKTAKEACLSFGGKLLTTEKQESDSRRRTYGGHVGWGPTYRTYSGYSLITCDLSSRAADIIIEIDKVLIELPKDIENERIESKDYIDSVVIKILEASASEIEERQARTEATIQSMIKDGEELLKIKTILLNQ